MRVPSPYVKEAIAEEGISVAPAKMQKVCLAGPESKKPNFPPPFDNSTKPIIEKQSLLRGDRKCEAEMSKEKSSPINGTFCADLLISFLFCVFVGERMRGVISHHHH